MAKTSITIFAALLIAGISPAFAAKSDCDTGYKDFVGKMSPYVDKMSGDQLAAYIRKGLGAYDSCTAGDNSITPHGVWDGILAEMAAKK